MKKILLFLLIPLLAVSCGDDTDYEFDRFFIASEKRYMDFGDRWAEGYVISVNNRNEWQYFPHEIEGLDYQKGKEYLVHLKVYQANDANGNRYNRYVLHKLVSATDKVSENMPTEYRGDLILASEMRMDAEGANANKCYVIKDLTPEPEPEVMQEVAWALLQEKYLLFDNYEEGGEYNIEYHKSNMSPDNKTGSEIYYRVISAAKTANKSEGLPGFAIDTEED